jgi:hypothetical protein
LSDDAENSRTDARQTLLRALDELDSVTHEHGTARRTYICVVFSHQVKGRTISGWTSTDDPPFVTSALLRRVADVIDLDYDDEDEDDDACG